MKCETKREKEEEIKWALGKSMWELGSRWAKCYEKRLAVYFRFSRVTQETISMGL